jgi:uncharacterized repeat protein (TIGR02543 family)
MFISVDFATVSTTLNITGSSDVTPPNYDEVVITDITVVSKTVDSERRSRIVPTNVNSVITGEAGDTIVYKITAHNYSETKSYAYKGMILDTEFYGDLNKYDISDSKDAQNQQPLPDNISSRFQQDLIVAPGDDFVFYVTYTLKENVSASEILVNYFFDDVIYRVTYLNNNETYALDYVTDNSQAYNVRQDSPSNGSYVFAGWININAVQITSIPQGNTNDYTLTAKWDDVYLIIFADAEGKVLYEEQFTSSSTKLSAEGQAIVDAKLAELNKEAANDHLTVSWSDYDIANATGDIVVKAIYNYAGYLNLVPVYEQPDDGIVDYYKVMAVDTLPETVVVPGSVGGVPVKVIERITNVDGENDWNNYENTVTRITIEEGVERLEWNSLAWTPYLQIVDLPSTINYMDKNVFSRNDFLGNDKKTITINFNGTKSEWRALLSKSNADWDGGLKKGTRVNCTDGYFELEGSWSLSWKEKSY